MRFKIIAANAVIVLIVGVVAFFLVRMTLAASGTKADQLAVEAKQDVQGAGARLQLDAISAEQWLTVKAGEGATMDALMKSGTAAGDAATARCTQIQNDSQNIDAFRGNPPTFVALLDLQGKVIGRGISNAQRGEDYGAKYPALKATTLATGQPGADVWLQTPDSYLASYVAVRDDKGKIAGALVVGRSLSDALSHVSDLTTGRPLELVMQTGDNKQVRVSSTKTDSATDNAIKGDGPIAQKMKKVLSDGHGSDVAQEGDLIVAGSALDALASGSRAALISPGAGAVAEPNFVGPVFGAVAMGLAMVILAGWLLGNYITRPIGTLEEGLLAILNGQADKRFELEHAELGGLAFRIVQLLNQLMGVEEDTTDAEGRPSQAPSAAHFSDAMSVEDKAPRPAGVDANVAAQLAAEPAPQYYARIYREYISAKKALNEATDHITEQAFASRIQGMEEDYSQKYGKPARYQVQANAKEVVLLAIPLP